MTARFSSVFSEGKQISG